MPSFLIFGYASWNRARTTEARSASTSSAERPEGLAGASLRARASAASKRASTAWENPISHVLR
ncbi:hypothetical protein CAG99_05960 [Streptomyces marincola]|uniref:Uncharacterized protein n=1 Tax=Streptomyces marincola TaxID=2878388 RepID=A0A1W7CUN4_9ACTN|nr:hypothetical protein CAG99_05960 [Streptomyces marincola]